MKTDAFTKILLLVIAIFLGIIALRPLVQVGTVQASSGSFGYLKSLAGSSGIRLMDTRNGDVWYYDFYRDKVVYKGRLVELGKSLVKHRK